MRTLSQKTLGYYDAIKVELESGNKAPTVRELASRFRVSVFTAAYHRSRLAEFGLIIIEPYENHGVRLNG